MEIDLLPRLNTQFLRASARSRSQAHTLFGAKRTRFAHSMHACVFVRASVSEWVNVFVVKLIMAMMLMMLRVIILFVRVHSQRSLINVSLNFFSTSLQTCKISMQMTFQNYFVENSMEYINQSPAPNTKGFIWAPLYCASIYGVDSVICVHSTVNCINCMSWALAHWELVAETWWIR